MPTSAGEIYAQAGRDIGEHISSAMTRWQELRRHDEDAHQKAQGLLDAASSIMVSDGKGGQKQFLNKEQIATATNLLHMHKEAQAQAYMQAQGFMQAAHRAAIMNNATAGPIVSRAQDGTPMKLNPQTGTWETYVPRNAQGQSATSVQNIAQRKQAFQERTVAAQQDKFDTKILKPIGLTRADLFNPLAQQEGTVNQPHAVAQSPGFWSNLFNNKPKVAPSDMQFQPLQPGQTPNAVRIGYRPPTDPTNPNDKGSPGRLVSPDDLKMYQDMAIQMGDPDLSAQKKAIASAQSWIDANPDHPKVDAVSDALNQRESQFDTSLKNARSKMQTNPEYKAQILGAGMGAGVDTTTQFPQGSDTPAEQPAPDANAAPPADVPDEVP